MSEVAAVQQRQASASCQQNAEQQVDCVVGLCNLLKHGGFKPHKSSQYSVFGQNCHRLDKHMLRDNMRHDTNALGDTLQPPVTQVGAEIELALDL